MHVLADFLYWWGLLEVGLAMIDGSYYRESIHDDRNFSEPFDGSAGQADG
jgi:hypothetical protein